MPYQPPEFWNFPPFFTIQPVYETREKQIRLWKELIVNFHASNGSYLMVPSNFPLFENKSIGRKLNDDGISVVIRYLLETGAAEWEDALHSRLRILWKTPESLATEIYSWAASNNFVNNVFTVYELLSGDEYTDSAIGFHGIESGLFRKAIQLLSQANKCIVIPGVTPDEDGVKFI